MDKASLFHAGHLLHVCKQLMGQGDLDLCVASPNASDPSLTLADVADVKGQQHAKRALEVAASGGHSLIFVGPPGTGKSMLASRLPSILPELTQDEALATAAIQSIAFGDFEINGWKQRPMRAPHHSCSSAALLGGGSIPKPGEISKAHNGILFLDELTEFSRATLEQLREPLETGVVNIARASRSVTYPAGFMLVAACNPCKCGFLGDDTDRCQCSAASIESYRSKLSGPMLDRIDMHVHLPRVSLKELQNSTTGGDSSAKIRARVSKCRARQLQSRNKLNSQFNSKELETHCRLDDELLDFLANVCERLNMSARVYHRILKLARTIADMAGEQRISKAHLSEAVAYRSLDRR